MSEVVLIKEFESVGEMKDWLDGHREGVVVVDMKILSDRIRIKHFNK